MYLLFRSEECFQGIFLQLRSDYAESAHDDGLAEANICFSGNVVEMDPLIAIGSNNALCTEYHAVFPVIQQFVEDIADFLFGVFTDGFTAPAGEYFIRMMVTAGTLAVMMMFVVMMMPAGTLAVMMMLVVMMMTAGAFIIVVMFVVVMMTAGAFFIVMMFVVVMVPTGTFIIVVMFVVMMVSAGTFIIVVMFVVMMMSAGAFIIVVMFVVMMVSAGAFFIVMMVLFFHFVESVLQGIFLLHCLYDLLTCELIPGGSDDGGVFVGGAQQLNTFLQLIFFHAAGSGEHDAVGVFYLVVEKFAEVLHVHFALVCIDDGGIAVENQFVGVDILHSLDYVGEFAYAGGLNKDAIGGIFRKDFFQGFAEISHEAAADTAGVHFRNFDACILHETAVDADFAEFIFNEN